MTHSLTFNYFNNFIHEKKQSHVVYLNLYMLIELYKKKLDVLYLESKMQKSTMSTSSVHSHNNSKNDILSNSDIKNPDDP